jgi:hypothetical protein
MTPPAMTVPASDPTVPARSLPPQRRGWLRNGNRPGDFLAAPRCGAKTRRGRPCRAPAMANGRCRMHGGASTGARTADGLGRCRRANWKHGCRSAAWAAQCRRWREEVRYMEASLTATRAAMRAQRAAAALGLSVRPDAVVLAEFLAVHGVDRPKMTPPSSLDTAAPLPAHNPADPASAPMTPPRLRRYRRLLSTSR